MMPSQCLKCACKSTELFLNKLTLRPEPLRRVLPAFVRAPVGGVAGDCSNAARGCGRVGSRGDLGGARCRSRECIKPTLARSTSVDVTRPSAALQRGVGAAQQRCGGTQRCGREEVPHRTAVPERHGSARCAACLGASVVRGNGLASG